MLRLCFVSVLQSFRLQRYAFFLKRPKVFGGKIIPGRCAVGAGPGIDCCRILFADGRGGSGHSSAIRPRKLPLSSFVLSSLTGTLLHISVCEIIVLVLHVNQSPCQAYKCYDSYTNKKNYQFHLSIGFSSTVKQYKSPCRQNGGDNASRDKQ